MNTTETSDAWRRWYFLGKNLKRAQHLRGRERIAVINIVAAHFHVLLSSLIINSKPRARGQKDASTRAWNPLRGSESHAIPSFVRTSTAAFPRCYANERASKTKTILGRASTESYYDLQFAGQMRIEYLYRFTSDIDTERNRVKRLIVTRYTFF